MDERDSDLDEAPERIRYASVVVPSRSRADTATTLMDREVTLGVVIVLLSPVVTVFFGFALYLFQVTQDLRELLHEQAKSATAAAREVSGLQSALNGIANDNAERAQAFVERFNKLDARLDKLDERCWSQRP